MSTERDELAELLWENAEREVSALADAILAAGYTKPRQVTTATEMDALGFQAVVIDSYNTPYICERFRTDGTRAEWQQSGTSHLIESEDVLEHGPITVLYSPATP